MYRFNSFDYRLERMLAIALMIMESLHGFDHKFRYAIQGHSGDYPDISFVKYDSPPKTIKERFMILKKMYSHTVFCQSGDYTLEAAQMAIDDVGKQEGDKHFVFVLSDANLRRYGISPGKLANVLTADPKVKAFAIFIASLGDEAERITTALPPGRGVVCTDTSELPQLFKKLLTSNLMK